MMEHSNEIIGYRILHGYGEVFLCHSDTVGNHLSSEAPAPIARGDAFRRLADFLDDFPDLDHEDFTIEPVYRELTPMEQTARELGGQLESLCARHGLDLGLTREQMEAALTQELKMFAQFAPRIVR